MGLFIAIEGGDGSGKATQTKLLAAYLREKLNKNVLTLSFPRHGEFSAYYTDQYLNKSYGENPDDIPADLVSLAYAIDRHAASKEIIEHINIPDGIVLADRFVASNAAHQGTKFHIDKERQDYYERIFRTEHEILSIPKPDLNIVLIVPVEISQTNVDKKPTRNYTTMKRDLHEENASHLERAKSNYIELTKLYPDTYKAILCTNTKGEMRSVDSIHEEIIRMVSFYSH